MDLAGPEAAFNPDPMAPVHDRAIPLRPILARLAGIRVRRLFGTDAYFSGPVMFAFLADEGLVLRLPDGARESALQSGVARPFLGPLPAGLHGWVVMEYSPASAGWIDAAHAAARGMARSVARRRGRGPARAGRTAGGEGD